MLTPRTAPRRLSALAAALLAACAGNAPVKIPDADPTAPLSALDVVESSGKRTILFSGGMPGDLDLAAGDSVVLIALGEDRDGGVKDLTLSGKAVATCADASGRGEIRKSGSFARRQVLPARPGEEAPVTRNSRYVLRADDFRKLCGDLELLRVTGSAGVRAVNYHGKSSDSPTLEFTVAMGPPFRADRGAAKGAGQGAARGAATASAQTGPPQASQATQETAPVYGPLPPPEPPESPRI